MLQSYIKKIWLEITGKDTVSLIVCVVLRNYYKKITTKIPASGVIPDWSLVLFLPLD
jgi:hypothetical protein